jgi:predicted Zn-dependent protease
LGRSLPNGISAYTVPPFRMRALFVFLVGMLVLGCGCGGSVMRPGRYVRNDPPVRTMVAHIPVWVDADMPKSQKKAIREALEEWNFTLNGYTVLELETENFKMEQSVIDEVVNTHEGIIIVSNRSSDVLVQLIDDEAVLAWVNELGGNVMHVISDRIGRRDMKSIAMHEIGHALGLPHILVKHTMMFPSYTFGSTCIDEVTVRALASVRSRYDVAHMNYCKLD